MIGFDAVFLSMILGFLVNYFLGLNYLKGLRGEKKESKDTTLILCSIVWGSLIYLIMYAIFSEIRNEDKINKYRFLISQIVILVCEVVLLILLIYFNVITFEPLFIS